MKFRNKILSIILQQNKIVHFVLENITMNKNDDINTINNLFNIKKTYEKCIDISHYKDMLRDYF